MTTVIMNLANIFNDLGTGSAVIQKQNPEPGFFSYVFRINIFTGFIIMLLVILLSPLIVSYYKQPELYGMLLLLSLSFPISSMSIVHKAFLEKQMKFKSVIKVEIFASIFSMIVAVIMANLGFGVYSIIAQTLITIALITIGIIFISDLKLNFHIENKEIDKSNIINFSGHLLSFNLVNYFSRNLDSILIGRFFSAVVLGSYSIAYRIMLFPLQTMTFVISRVLLPHFSKNLHDTDKNREHFFRSVHIILSLSAPLMLLLAAISHDFIKLFFDSKWSQVGDMLVWLAPTAIIQSVLSITGSIFISYAKTKWLFYLGLLGAILMATAFSVGVYFDIMILIKLYLIFNMINFFPVMILVGKILNFRLREISPFLLKAIVPALLMFACVWFANLNFFYGMMTYQKTIIEVLLALLSYSIFYFLFNHKEVLLLFKLVAKR